MGVPMHDTVETVTCDPAVKRTFAVWVVCPGNMRKQHIKTVVVELEIFNNNVEHSLILRQPRQLRFHAEHGMAFVVITWGKDQTKVFSKLQFRKFIQRILVFANRNIAKAYQCCVIREFRQRGHDSAVMMIGLGESTVVGHQWMPQMQV